MPLIFYLNQFQPKIPRVMVFFYCCCYTHDCYLPMKWSLLEDFKTYFEKIYGLLIFEGKMILSSVRNKYDNP